MILGWLLVAALGATPSLAEAQAALAQGDPEGAERLALEAVAANPRSGGALLILGLSRFRQERPAEALEALDRAAQAPEDVPERALLEYNRGSCLTALGRPVEAEQAFLRAAASSPELAPVAEVSAGLAALDAGAVDRARAAADRAAALPSIPGLPELIAQLRAQIAAAEGRAADEQAARAAEEADAAATEGMAHFDAERYADAERSFLRATRLQPSVAVHHLMAGASAYHLGERAAARARMEQALKLGLEEGEAAIAREYLEVLSPGLRSRGEGLAFRATADTGMDTNVLQSGIGFTERLIPRGPGGPGGTGSPFASVMLSGAYRRALGDALFGELTYALDQVAYASPLLSENSLQQHAFSATVEWSVLPRLRLSLGPQGDALFIGLSQFRGVQTSLGGAASLSFDETEWLTTRLKLEAGRKQALSSEFSAYAGGRLDVTATQEAFRWARGAVGAWYRHREERIGTALDATYVAPVPLPGESQGYVIPFAYRSSMLGATAAALLPARWRATVELGVEWRRYLADSYLNVLRPDGTTLEANHRRREDLRLTASVAASLPLGAGFELGARYDLLFAASTINNQLHDGQCLVPDLTCHELDYANQTFRKHALSISLGYTR